MTTLEYIVHRILFLVYIATVLLIFYGPTAIRHLAATRCKPLYQKRQSRRARPRSNRVFFSSRYGRVGLTTTTRATQLIKHEYILPYIYDIIIV